MIQPKISVVTVCYNAAETIEQTMQSVINQTYENIEYIIIDGGSTDGTVEIIKKYADKIAYWVSEPDKGIYDAMNKGIKVATGEWIGFLNSGDFYLDSNVLSSLIYKSLSYKHPDVIYGYTVYSFKYGKFVGRKLPLSKFRKTMPFGHPSTFVRTELMKESLFDCSYKIAADYNFLYNLYTSNKQFCFVDVIVTDFESETGVSNKSLFLTMKETAIINGSYGSIGYMIHYCKVAVNDFIKMTLEQICPKVISKIQKREREHNNDFIPLKEFLLSRKS